MVASGTGGSSVIPPRSIAMAEACKTNRLPFEMTLMVLLLGPNRLHGLCPLRPGPDRRLRHMDQICGNGVSNEDIRSQPITFGGAAVITT